MVKLVDALASGASIRKDVKVRVLSWAPVRGDKTLSLRSLDRDKGSASAAIKGLISEINQYAGTRPCP